MIVLFSEDENLAKFVFEKFNKEENEDKCLDFEEKSRLDDNQAREIIRKVSKKKNISDIQGLDKKSRNRIIKALKDKEGLSIRQISRLTGVSFGIVRGI